MRRLGWVLVGLAVVLGGLLSGCESDGGSSGGLTGTWVSTGIFDDGSPYRFVLTFNADGTGSFSDTVNNEDFGQGSLTWSTSGSTLTIQRDDRSNSESVGYSVSGDKLTLYLGSSRDTVEVYYRQ
jgi:hypothetical protein